METHRLAGHSVDGIARPLKGYRDRNRLTLRKLEGKPDRSQRKEGLWSDEQVVVKIEHSHS